MTNAEKDEAGAIKINLGREVESVIHFFKLMKKNGFFSCLHKTKTAEVR